MGESMFQTFMNIDNLSIPGESKDAKHKNWIDVLSFHWDVMMPQNLRTGEMTGPIQLSLFGIVKVHDMSSPRLLQAMILSKRFDSIKLEVCYKGGDNDGMKLVEYVLGDVIIASYKIRAETVGENRTGAPLEDIALGYGKIRVSGYAIDEKNISKLAGEVEWSWERL
jgi:type VI secretion system secreted protein Hcp